MNDSHRTLKKKIEEKLKCTITQYHHCTLLHRKMKSEGLFLSANTIARYFNILPHRNNIYNTSLNLLAQFVGYVNFESLQQSEAFDYQFQIAIAKFQWNVIQENKTAILANIDAIDIDQTIPWPWVRQLGYAVKQKPHFLIPLLSNSEKGQVLFFESFVDEDNHDGYFSKALDSNFTKRKSNIQNEIFYNCFNFSQSVYRNNKNLFKNNTQWLHDITIKNHYHFHNISRIIECQWLMLPEKHSLLTFSKIIQLVLDRTHQKKQHEQSWILARTIKALAQRKWMEKALKDEQFKSLLINNFWERRMDSIADLIIQWAFMKWISPNQNILFLENINRSFDENTKMMLESDCLLMAMADQSNDFLLNRETFAKKSGTLWTL